MPELMKENAKAAIESLAKRRLRWRKRREARAALTVLSRNGRQLAPAHKRLAFENAIERFGAARHADWLMVNASVQGRFCDNWLADSYYIETVMPQVNGTAHHLARVSATNAAFFKSPAQCDLLYSINGRLLSADLVALSPAQALECLNSAGPMVVFKADQSGFGRGVQSIDVGALDSDTLANIGNGVFQRKIRGHSTFERFGSEALATLRIGTVLLPNGTPKANCCYLKLGRPGQSHVVAKDQVRVAVDWHSGGLDGIGYLSDWTPCLEPPESGARFDGVVLPAVSEATKVAESLHKQLPLAGFVCWDFAIDQDAQVRLLEWEGGVVSFAEAVQGPCFLGLEWSGMRAQSDDRAKLPEM